MFVIGKRPLTETQKAEQAARFAKKIDKSELSNANLVKAMRFKLKAK